MKAQGATTGPIYPFSTPSDELSMQFKASYAVRIHYITLLTYSRARAKAPPQGEGPMHRSPRRRLRPCASGSRHDAGAPCGAETLMGGKRRQHMRLHNTHTITRTMVKAVTFMQNLPRTDTRGGVECVLQFCKCFLPRGLQGGLGCFTLWGGHWIWAKGYRSWDQPRLSLRSKHTEAV